jgi:hypothetical protein
MKNLEAMSFCEDIRFKTEPMFQFVVPVSRSGGVYDFARKLQESIGNHVAMVHLSKENAANWKISESGAVVLQMSGYGFDKRGAPLWLLNELEKRRRHIKTLGVFFHELYASGPPWSSSFWLSPIQRHIARRLVESSDFWMTSRKGSAQWLGQFAAIKPHAVLPVFSNVGELNEIPQTRLPRIVVFGSPGLREMTYRAAGEKLFSWAEQSSLQVHDIGAPVEDGQLAETLRTKGVVLHGRMVDRDISVLMGGATFGLVSYSVNVIAKSGVFAAYCAHGLCPILISEDYKLTDGLIPGVHYLPGLKSVNDAGSVCGEIGRNAWVWYQPHSVSAHAKALVELIVAAGCCHGQGL